MALAGLLCVAAAILLYQATRFAPEPKAYVEGPYVVVTVYGTSLLDAVRVGKYTDTEVMGSAKVKLPVEELGPGHHVLEVELVEDGDVDVVEVAVDIPSAALEPYLAIDCDRTHGDVELRSAHLSPRMKTAPKCKVPHRDDELRLQIATHFDAALTVDGEPHPLAEGEGVVEVPLRDVVAEHLVADAEGKLSAAGAEEITLPLTVKRKTGAIESQVTVMMGPMRRHHLERKLEEQARSLPVPWLAGAGDPSIVLYVEQPFETTHRGEKAHFGGRMRLVGDAGARAIDAGRIAVAEAGKHRAYKCGGYTGSGMFPVVNLTHELVVTVYDRAGKQLARRAFPAPPNRCPEYVVGENGKTSHYRQRAGFDAVSRWLRTLRR